jgi:transposase InsO family protein
LGCEFRNVSGRRAIRIAFQEATDRIRVYTLRPNPLCQRPFGSPEFEEYPIFNTDQGSQFTSFAFTTTLKDAGIRISMNGRGRWMDNVFIERLWRSLKYECVFLSAFETGSEARDGIGPWIDYYNRRRPHSTFGGRTPDEVYATVEMTEQLAA